MKDYLLGTILCVMLLGIWSVHEYCVIEKQQRQIDQNSAIMLKMVRSQWVVESDGNTGLRGGVKYEFQFADFSLETAVLKILNPSQTDEKTHCIIVHSVRQEVLDDWVKHPNIE